MTSGQNANSIEANYQKMIATAPVLLWMSGTDQQRFCFNPEWLRFSGHSQEQEQGRGWTAGVQPEDLPACIAAFSSAAAEQKAYTIRYRMRRHDGVYRCLLENGVPRYNDDGKFEGFTGSCIDITDELSNENDTSMQASAIEDCMLGNSSAAADKDRFEKELQHLEHALASSDARFQYLIKEAPIAIAILHGRELVVELPNYRILQVWGKTEDIIGLPLKEALPELLGQPFLRILDHVFVDGVPFYANEIRSLLKQNGLLKEIFFNLVYQPLKDLNGITTDILVVAIDVTEQVNARKSIEKAKETLQLAIEAAELGTYHINLNKGELVSSDRLKEFFGFLPSEEMTYQDAAKQIDYNYRATASHLVELAITTGQKFDFEFPVKGKNDDLLRWLRAVGTIQENGEGTERYFTGVLNEITQKKLDEQRKNDFIAMVSHELKTPLTSLSALLQILSTKLKQYPDAFIPTAVDKCIAQVKKMNSLISGFLNVSQLESGKIKLEISNFDLCSLTAEVIEDQKLTNSDHIITFIHKPGMQVDADRNKISSVISNFLSNALKYSPPGTGIEADCSLENDMIKVSIIDHGMGISQQSVSKIFDRFYRVESTAMKNITGFGIGLYLASEIITHHNGKIGVESSPGKGSTFWFTLPCGPHQEAPEKYGRS